MMRTTLTLILASILALAATELIQRNPKLDGRLLTIQGPEGRLGLKCPSEVDYSPQCICDYWPYETYNAYCNASTYDDLRVIQQTFERSPIVDHTEVRISITSSSKIPIPANMFSNKTVGNIIIECVGNAAALGAIDPQAFIASAGKTSSFTIAFCDLTDFDFAFFAQLRVLQTLQLRETSINTITKMPLMPHMRTVTFTDIRGLQEWYNPAQTPYLDTIMLSGMTGTSPDTMESILETLLYYENSLVGLYLVNLGLGRVPPAVRNFSRLSSLNLNENLITTLPAGSLSLRSTLSALSLGSMPIQSVEPFAFDGNFRATWINMWYDKLTAFPREVFESMLEDMIYAGGSIDLYGNPVVCDDCHLNWIINEKRYLLKKVTGKCANGSDFEELDASAYDARCTKAAAASLQVPFAIFIFIIVFSFVTA